MDCKIEIVLADITTLRVDAIVNAANNSLLGGMGVDGAIHRAAGQDLLEECRGIGGCPTGEARMTNGYLLPAGYVIHTVGPIWNGGFDGEESLLKSCYENCLKLANSKSLQTIAFPAISTGAYRFPLEQATQIAIRTVQEFLQSNEHSIKEILFVCFHQKAVEVYTRILNNT